MLSTIIERIVPGWMRQRAHEHWLGLAFVVAAGHDALADAALDATLSDMPGQVDQADGVGYDAFSSIDALPLIGRDRRIAQGLTETPADYAARLRDWRAIHRRRGTPYGLLHELRAILSPDPPTVRLVNDRGFWWSLEAGGDFVFNTPAGVPGGFRMTQAGVVTAEPDAAYPWDWDSAAPDLEDPLDTMRFWLIVYAPAQSPLDGDGGTFDGSRHVGEGDATIGTTATTAFVRLARGVVDDAKSFGMECLWLIVAFDPTSFDPLAAPGTPGYPDGTWKHFGKVATVAGRLTRVRARPASARYWRGRVGT